MAQSPTRDTSYDAVVIGSGFGSLFFIEGFLRKRPKARVLVLERGQAHGHAWQLAQQRNSALDPQVTFRTPPGHKTWNFTIGLGGGTNCWFGNTPRMHPSDFRLRSRYGVGQDWPLDYEELERHYVAAEQRMSVAGANEIAAVLPRSAPFPLPAHPITSVDRAIQRAQPMFHFPLPTARASTATAGRGKCCANARCNLCPVDAKFTFWNGFAHLRANPAIEFRVDSEVTRLDVTNGIVRGVVYRRGEREHFAHGDLVVLGANAIHSPAILLRSGLDHPLTGIGINEQVGYSAEALIRGIDNFDGGTITTSLNYSLYDGEFRKNHGAALVLFDNRWPLGLRLEVGRWRQLVPLIVNVEDLPQASNRVVLDSDGFQRVLHADVSDYARRGVEQSFAALGRVLAPLDVERIVFRGIRPVESHIQGSLRMGHDRSTSVVDARQVHHDVSNLVVVGSSVFPTCPPAPPSLTVAALSLRSAELLA
jgi:choline dehydrogenase-like flavoprotein